MNLMKSLKSNVLFYILITSPIFFYIVSLMGPVGDDLTYFTSSYPGSLWKGMMPIYSWWRPFDALLGHIIYLYPSLFPLINHLIVCAFHLTSTVIFYLIIRRLDFKQLEQNIATLFFYLTPSILGAIFDTDAINQTGALFFDLLGFYVFAFSRKGHVFGWLLLTFIAILFKENGITWFVITPLLAWTFDIRRKEIIKGLCWGVVMAIMYGVLRLSLPHSGAVNDEYFDFSLRNELKTLSKLITLVFVPTDNILFIHDHRLLLGLLSFVCSASLMFYLLIKARTQLLTRIPLMLLLLIFIALSPHLVTLFTVMHAYGVIPFTALLLAWALSKVRFTRVIWVLLSLFLLSCIEIDAHHTIEKYKSGQRMLSLSHQALELLGPEPVDSVFSITINGNYTKYSTFCANASDAFAWGNAVQNLTHYKWPKVWKDTTMNASPQSDEVYSVGLRAYKQGYCYVLIVTEDSVYIAPHLIKM
jgi:hypothetical protein